MEQNNLLKQILIQIRKLEALTESIASQPDAVYRMDIEYLKQNAVQLYDLLHQLQAIDLQAIKFQAEVEQPQPKPHLTEHAPLPDVELVKDEQISTPVTETNVGPLHDVDEELDIDTLTRQYYEELGLEKEAVADDVTEVGTSVKYERPTASHEKLPITLDLFEDQAPERLGEKLASDDFSIAARMQKSRVEDLRSAIGINDKFLFINELFGGNLNQYNKTIDELNHLVSLDGARAYLIELRIQHQWSAHAPAVEKLHDLVERKFRYNV